MFRYVLNKLTIYSIFGIILAITFLVISRNTSPEGTLTFYFLLFSVFFFIISIFVEGYGIYISRHYFKEHAQEIYFKVNRIVEDIRTLLNESHKQDLQKETANNKSGQRYKDLNNQLNKTLSTCVDLKLKYLLKNFINQEKLLAKYGLSEELKVTGEERDQEIRNYIEAHFKQKPLPGLQNK